MDQRTDGKVPFYHYGKTYTDIKNKSYLIKIIFNSKIKELKNSNIKQQNNSMPVIVLRHSIAHGKAGHIHTFSVFVFRIGIP